MNGAVERLRTPSYRELKRQASELERHLWYSMFVTAEFDEAWQVRAQGQSAESFLSESYPNNPYIRRLNVRVRDFSKSRESYQGWMLQSLFIYLYAVADFYEHDVCTLIQTIVGGHIETPERTDRLAAAIAFLGDPPDKQSASRLQLTRSCIRWRRNRILHSRGSLSDDLKKLVKNHGKDLDTYWRSRFGHAKKYEIDFRDGALGTFTVPELVGFAGIVRHLYADCDQVICLLLNQRHRAGLLAEVHRAFCAVPRNSKSALSMHGATTIRRKFSLYADRSLPLVAGA